MFGLRRLFTHMSFNISLTTALPLFTFGNKTLLRLWAIRFIKLLYHTIFFHHDDKHKCNKNEKEKTNDWLFTVVISSIILNLCRLAVFVSLYTIAVVLYLAITLQVSSWYMFLDTFMDFAYFLGKHVLLWIPCIQIVLFVHFLFAHSSNLTIFFHTMNCQVFQWIVTTPAWPKENIRMEEFVAFTLTCVPFFLLF